MADENISSGFLRRQLAELRAETAHLKSGGGGDRFHPMEPRVAKLEASVEHIQRDIADIKLDLRGLRADDWSNFKIMLFGGIAATLGLAGLMAKGFHWI